MYRAELNRLDITNLNGFSSMIRVYIDRQGYRSVEVAHSVVGGNVDSYV